MTWREKVVIRILLLVARMVGEERWSKDIETLSTHIGFSSDVPTREAVLEITRH